MLEGGEIAHLLKAFVPLSEIRPQSSVSISITCNSSSRGLMPSSGFHGYLQLHAYTPHTYIQNLKIIKINLENIMT